MTWDKVRLNYILKEGAKGAAVCTLENIRREYNAYQTDHYRDAPGLALGLLQLRIMITMQAKRHTVIPGFGISIGLTILYLSLIVLIPLSSLFLKTFTMGWGHFWQTITAPRVLASYKISFLASFFGALTNAVFGLVIVWVLVRYPFPGKKLVDALIDLPFALPTSVAGISLTALYSENGWIGYYLKQLGIQVAFTPLGIYVALTFIGLPFVVRTVQPVLQDLSGELEEAASSLGANRLQIFWLVIMPNLWPALLTGFSLAFARALGEYGSVVFISGNRPMHTEITPLLIITKLEQYDYTGATAIAVTMLIASFLLLLLINSLQWWSGRRFQKV